MADTDRLAAELAAIGERNDQWIVSMALTEASVNDSPFGDLRRLLAAVEVALSRHTPGCHERRGKLVTHCSLCRASWPCREVQAITRELLGVKEAGDG